MFFSNSEIKLMDNINLKEYLMTSSMDELDFDELIEREKRPFCRMFFDRLLVHQMIIDLFFNNNWIIPKPIKTIFFIEINTLILISLLFFFFLIKIFLILFSVGNNREIIKSSTELASEV